VKLTADTITDDQIHTVRKAMIGMPRKSSHHRAILKDCEGALHGSQACRDAVAREYNKMSFAVRMKEAKAKQTPIKIVPASPPKEALDNWAADVDYFAAAIEKLRHPSGDSIEVEAVDRELIAVTIKGGPHEICKIALTGPETDVLLASLQRARKKVKP
jgi:hypothetical protein